MAIDDETYAWRRNLPHLQKLDRNYFITFVTQDRVILTPEERDLVLRSILRAQGKSLHIYIALVMPDHVHLITMIDASTTLPIAIQFIKAAASRAAGRRLWQREYFDRIVRHGEDLRKKGDYTLNNPVHDGLVANPDDYPWKWRLWIEGAVT